MGWWRGGCDVSIIAGDYVSCNVSVCPRATALCNVSICFLTGHLGFCCAQREQTKSAGGAGAVRRSKSKLHSLAAKKANAKVCDTII